MQDSIEKINLSWKTSEYEMKQWTGADIQSYLNLYNELDMDDFEIQILFEQRSSGEKEKFPSQVSLPGGKPDENENLLQTAIRETFEETSIELLNSKNFAYIGEFPATLPFMQLQAYGKIYVKCFMFIQLNFDIIKVVPNPGEIDKWIWTSLQFFAENPDNFYCVNRLRFFPNSAIELEWWLPSIKLLDSELYSLWDLYKNPELISDDFKLGGLTYYFVYWIISYWRLIKKQNPANCPDKEPNIDHFHLFHKFFIYSVKGPNMPLVSKILGISNAKKYDPNTFYNKKTLYEFRSLKLINILI